MAEPAEAKASSPDAGAQRRNPGVVRDSFADFAALHPGYLLD
jgi:hypothetical protein